jgi:signal transduction histidine kinase
LRDGRAARISDMPFTDPGGRQRFLDLDLSPVRDRDAGLTGALLFALDVTERRVLLDQLLQAQKLESIGHLAAGIAHEINTPAQCVGDNMHFLQGAFDSLNQVLDRYVELAGGCRHVDSVAGMLREIEDLTRDLDLPFLRGEAVVAIRQSLDGLGRISAIVRAMKDFSRPNSAEKVHADLNRAIESTITVARNEWKYVADVVTDLSPDLPPIQCHIGQINQVVLNILVNGAHAITERTGDSGVLGRIDVTTRRDGAWVEIRVSDTGTGIPESARSKVFDHFFTTKAVGKGTGQGLAIAHTVIKQHGGTITFETETDKGTTFIVRLPINSEASTPVSTGAHSTV